MSLFFPTTTTPSTQYSLYICIYNDEYFVMLSNISQLPA